MSALRIARPGLPVVLIDLGPSVARKTFSRYGIRGGGTMVTGQPAKTRDAVATARRADYAEQRERYNAAQRAYRARKAS